MYSNFLLERKRRKERGKSNFTEEKLDEYFTAARGSRLTTLVSHADRYVVKTVLSLSDLPLKNPSTSLAIRKASGKPQLWMFCKEQSQPRGPTET